MADDNKNNANQVKIKVVLDSEEAKGKLDELQAKIDNLFGRGNGGSASGGTGGGVGGGGSAGGGTGEAGNAQQSSTMQQRRNGQEQARGFNSQFRKDIPILGKLIGGAVGTVITKTIIGGIELSRLGGYHAGESQYMRNRQHDIGKSAVSYGGSGMALGALIGGPVGALIGGIGGLIVGPLIAAFKADQKQRIYAEQTALNINRGNAESAQQFMSGVAGSAFSRAMSFEQSREKRIAVGVSEFDKYLKEAGKYQDEAKARTSGKWNGRMEEVWHTNTTTSGGTTSWKERKMVYDEAEDENSENVKTAQANAEQMKNLAFQRLNYAFEQKYLAKQISPWGASDFASDSYAKRGITIGGAGFDVTKANEPIVKHLAQIAADLKKFTNVTGRGNQMSIEEMSNVAKMFGLQ